MGPMWGPSGEKFLKSFLPLSCKAHTNSTSHEIMWPMINCQWESKLWDRTLKCAHVIALPVRYVGVCSPTWQKVLIIRHCHGKHCFFSCEQAHFSIESSSAVISTLATYLLHPMPKLHQVDCKWTRTGNSKVHGTLWGCRITHTWFVDGCRTHC